MQTDCTWSQNDSMMKPKPKVTFKKTTPKTIFDERYRALVQAIISMRKKKNLSQRALAELMGRSHNFIARTEMHERRLDYIDVVDILKAMGLSKSEILKFLEKFI